MRAAATSMLLLQVSAALLLGVAQCSPWQSRDPTPLQQAVQIPDSTQQQQQQQVGNGWQEESKESLEDYHDDDSFIASEETEEGKLWASDDDPDWTPSESDEEEWYSDEDYQSEESSEEEYYSLEDDQSEESGESQEYVIPQQGVQPFPEVTFPPLPQYNQWENEVDYGHTHLPPVSDLQQQSTDRGKRYVKRHYQSSQQVEQVTAPYQNQQGQIDSEVWDSVQDGRGEYQGVEPVLPVEGSNQYEVGKGVEPERESTAVDTDEESRGSSQGGWFGRGWRAFTGAVEDLGEKVENAAGRVHETFSGTVDKLHQTYSDVRDKLPQLLERFKTLILKFGTVIQEGARYCLGRFEHAVDQARESEVIEKLKTKLEEGHAEVAQFFQTLGEKVQEWREEHGTTGDVDAGLIDGYKPVDGQTLQEGVQQQSQDTVDMPDFFQDDQVIVQLHKLQDVGILTEDDVIILTQQHTTQNEQHQHQDQQSHHQHQDQQSHHQHQDQQSHHQHQDQQSHHQHQDQQSHHQHQDQQSHHQHQDQQSQQQNQDQQSQQQNQQQNYYNQQQAQSRPEYIQFPE